MTDDPFRLAIERGDISEVRRALDEQPTLANRAIRWYLNQHNESDPLHFVSDCVGHGWLTNGTEADIAQALLTHGAAINGTKNHEPPLIAAASLGAPTVARVLVEAGADIERVFLFGASALHWAAWTGDAATVELLVSRGAKIEEKCTEYGATPLFWAVHGCSEVAGGEAVGQLAAAKILIEAGARIDTANKEGTTALEQSKRCARQAMHEFLSSVGR
jgi:ankyrin repeat protein